MKLMDLFEYDPKVAAALGQAAQGVGQAADNLKGPIPLTAKLQDMETMLKDLNSKLNKALSDNPDIAVAPFFADWAENIAKKAGIKSFGLRVEPDKIVKGGKPNSAYVRGLIAQMIDQLNDKEKTDKGRKLKGSGFGKQFSKQKIKF